MIFRLLRPDDAEAVISLENRALPSPWSARQIASELRHPASLGVAAMAEEMSGFALLRAYAPECELLRLAVRPEERRRGIGTALLQIALKKCAVLGCTICFLEMRASNLAARRLYAALGFLPDGRRKNYYTHPEEDALLFHKNLSSLGEGHEKSA